MKDIVSDRLLVAVASLSVLGLGGTLFGSAGLSWPTVLALAALGSVLITATAVLLMGRRRDPAADLAQVIHDVEAEPSARSSPRR